MEDNKMVPAGESSRSTIPFQEICIVIVKDDITCNNMVMKMLQRWKHQVLRSGSFLDVLKAIWEAKDRIDLVLTNADKLESGGDDIVQHIKNTLNLPVISISPEKRKIESEGKPFTFAAYILNGSGRGREENLLRIAFGMVKVKTVAAHQEEEVQRTRVSSIAVETNKASSSIGDAARLNQKGKGVKLSKNSRDGHSPAKKPRVVWTIDMHKRFLDAINMLGEEKAVPKKIVEVMNIPSLTRENVASHLQKYRGSEKRTARRDFDGLPSPSTSRLNSLPTNMTSFPQSSYASTVKESFSPSKLLCINTRKDFSFGATSETKTYTGTGGLLFSDQSGVEKLQQGHVSKLQFPPNFRIYGDQKRNMLLSIDKTSNLNQSSTCKFVGYRVTTDGKSIEYGGIRASNKDKIDKEAVVSTPGTSGNRPANYSQHDAILDQKLFTSSTGGVPQQPFILGSPAGETSFQGQSVSTIHGNETPTQSTTITPMVNSIREVAFLSPAQKIETSLNLDPSTPLSSTSKLVSARSFQDSGNIDTEHCLSLLHQDNFLQSRERQADVAPFQNTYENAIPEQNASTATPSSIFPSNQDFSIPSLETLENDFHVQPSTAFLGGFSQLHYCPSPLPHMLHYFDDFLDQSGNDDPLLKRTGSTSHRFDLGEFCDSLFSQDD